jgi:hypothetical protein
MSIWSAVTCHRFCPQRLDAASVKPSIQRAKGCDRSQPTKALTGQRTPKMRLRHESERHLASQLPSPRTLTINATNRNASSPATALRPTVMRNSIPPARFFGAIIGRASISQHELIDGLHRFPLPGLAAWTTISADSPAKLPGWFRSFVQASLKPRAKRAASPRKALNNSSMMVLKA